MDPKSSQVAVASSFSVIPAESQRSQNRRRCHWPVLIVVVRTTLAHPTKRLTARSRLSARGRNRFALGREYDRSKRSKRVIRLDAQFAIDVSLICSLGRELIASLAITTTPLSLLEFVSIRRPLCRIAVPRFDLGCDCGPTHWESNDSLSSSIRRDADEDRSSNRTEVHFRSHCLVDREGHHHQR